MKQRLDRPEGCSGESLTAPRLGFELRYVAYYHHLSSPSDSRMAETEDVRAIISTSRPLYHSPSISDFRQTDSSLSMP